MRIRRCALLFVEARERHRFAFEDLLGGGTGVVAERGWVALAPHLEAEVELTAAELAVLGEVSASSESELCALEAIHAPEILQGLLDKSLLLGDHAAHAALRERDARLRDAYWWGPSAVAHAFGRWDGLKAGAAAEAAGLRTHQDLVDKLGAPPPALHARVDAAQRIALPVPPSSALDELLARRTTCRNFDSARALPVDALATVLHRVFAARAVHALAGAPVLKKSSPSGGGLHPIEAYVLAQRVDGLAPGLYHYHCGDHALEPLGALAPDAAAVLAAELVAGQSWFAPAPALIVTTARFARHQWKYRGHAKAYRVMLLEAGHFSQTLYLAATELGLGAFITCAINERAAERAFGLDGMEEGVIAVSGLGHRAAQMATYEFDPAHRVWPAR